MSKNAYFLKRRCKSP